MKRLTLAALAIAGLASSASAQGAPQMMTACATDFKAFWERINQGGSAKMTGEQVAGVSRASLRAYDACLAGDEQWSKQLWERLDRGAGGAKK